LTVSILFGTAAGPTTVQCSVKSNIQYSTLIGVAVTALINHRCPALTISLRAPGRRKMES